MMLLAHPDSSASAMQDSYKRLQELVDAGFKEANDRTKRSEIEKRVKDWEEGIRPYLDSYVSARVFRRFSLRPAQFSRLFLYCFSSMTKMR